MAGKRARDAGTGQMVSLEEAAARPNETVVEDVSRPTLEKRVAAIEAAIKEGGGLPYVLWQKHS